MSLREHTTTLLLAYQCNTDLDEHVRANIIRSTATMLLEKVEDTEYLKALNTLIKCKDNGLVLKAAKKATRAFTC